MRTMAPAQTIRFPARRSLTLGTTVCMLPVLLLMLIACDGTRTVAPPEQQAVGGTPPTGRGPDTPRAEPVSFRVLATDQYSGITGRLRIVLTDSAAWAQAWKQWTEPVGPQPPLPIVDFGTEMVVLVSQGEQWTGGYVIRVTSVVETGNGYLVSVQSQSPGCGATSSVTDPVEAIAVPRAAVPVTFAETDTVTARC